MPSGYCSKCGFACETDVIYVDLDAEHGVGGEFGGRRMQAMLVSCYCEAAVEGRQPYHEWAYTPEGREYRADEAADRRRDRRITEGY